MLLRPRQTALVDRCCEALEKKGNTLAVAPTGAGKTLMLSAVVGRRVDLGKALVVQHRDELVRQNIEKFTKINPRVPVSIVDANTKSWRGRAVFGMAQTLVKDKNLAKMPSLATIVIDEGHRTMAPSYSKIIDRAREINPDCAIMAVTATPQRGDKKSFRKFFDNVGDQIQIGELIQSGHLVRPRTFVIDVGTQEALKQVRRTASDFDQFEVEAIMNRRVINDEVIRHWREAAGDRQTIVFTSTVAHARDVCAAFLEAGVKAAVIDGSMSKTDRRSTLAAYSAGEYQVLVNCAVLTEGFDDQPTSCVILLRLSSYKSTMIQMIGRALRTVDPELHPGLIKTDAIILDFGTSCILHGKLEQDAEDALKEREPGEAPEKQCPECESFVPVSCAECPICGFVWPEPETVEVEDIEAPAHEKIILTEIDLLAKSNWKYIDLFDDGSCLMASGFDAWAGVFALNGDWYSIGGNGRQPKLLGVSDRIVALAQADDWLNDHETDSGAQKSARWLRDPATDKQRQMLGMQPGLDFSLTKYRASCLISHMRNKEMIKNLIFSYSSAKAA